MKAVILVMIILFFNACNFGESEKELAAKQAEQKRAFEEKLASAKEVQMKKIDAQKEQEIERIKSQRAVAELEKEQLLEKIKLQAQAEKERLLLEQKKLKEEFDAKLRTKEQQDAMEIKRYLVLLLFIALLIVSYFLYLYFKRRHDDKLKAYENNLNKYFHQQENMARMRIAEKIIDTVASGKLEKEQERELILALGSAVAPNQSTPSSQLLQKEIEAEIEVIEDKKE